MANRGKHKTRPGHRHRDADMNGNVFLFHKESDNSYVKLLPEKEGPFDALTVCMRSYPDLNRSYSLFSLNTPSQDNDFLLFPYPSPSNKLSVSVGGQDFYFNVPYSNDTEWRSTCVSWDSSTGVLVLWINGKPYPRKVFQKGYQIKERPIIIIGQEQDSYGGKFDASQSFVGEISDVHVWDEFLTYQEMYVYFTSNDMNDLGSKVLLFAKPTATAHVILKPVVTKPLNKLTVCVRSYTELTREHPLFSLAIAGSGKDNTFLIFPRPPNFCSVYIGQEEIRIKVDTEVLDWKHTCVSWESQSGVIQLWINGKLYPRRVSRKGFIIPPETSIVLGQEQDSFGGGFDVNQSFVGEISDVHVWDYVLNPEDIKGVLSNEKNGNLISWTSLNYELKGDVTAEPKLQCKSWGHTHSLYSLCYEDK
ncbi:C-reactive protein-like [Rhinophrynus dorsalis]